MTPCLWLLILKDLLLLTLKDLLLSRLLWFKTTDPQTGLNTSQLLIILQTDLFEDLQMTDIG